MSKVNKMVELISPRMNSASEQLKSTGHECNYCQGNGYFWGVDEYGEPIKEACPLCKGSGRLDAVVSIQWRASNDTDRR